MNAAGILALLFLASAATALVSGVTGLAGGALLFSCLTYIWSVREAIALHAATQSLSNGIRVGIFWSHIHWAIVARFAVLVVPGAYLGSLSLDAIPTQYLFGLAAIGILLAIFPTKHLPIPTHPNWFILGGFLAGFLGMLIGVVGPIIAPLFLNVKIIKEEFVATKSACQLITQGVKFGFFLGLLGFDYSQYAGEVLWMAGGLTLGTFAAKRILKSVSNRVFRVGIKGLLVATAIQLAYKGIAGTD